MSLDVAGGCCLRKRIKTTPIMTTTTASKKYSNNLIRSLNFQSTTKQQKCMTCGRCVDCRQIYKKKIFSDFVCPYDECANDDIKTLHNHSSCSGKESTKISQLLFAWTNCVVDVHALIESTINC